jgi:predicted nucleotidyltransferase
MSMDLGSVSADINRLVSADRTLIKRIGIFGSLARGDYNDGSDIDLLVEYASTPKFLLDRFDRFCGVCNKLVDFLSAKYGRRVDIVQFKGDPSAIFNDDAISDEVLWL